VSWRPTWLVPLVVLRVLGGGPCTADAPQPLAATFEAKYQAWLVHIRTPEVLLSGSGRPYVDCPEFQAIVEMGPPVLPLLFTKAHQDPKNEGWMYAAVARIAHCHFDSVEHAVAWWRNGSRETSTKSAELIARWDGLAAGDEVVLWTLETVYLNGYNEVTSRRRNVTPAGQVYQALENMGIAILPHLAEEFKQGKYAFVDMAYALTDNAPPMPQEIPVSVEGKAKGFLAWWEQNKAQWTIPWPTPEAPVTPAAATVPTTP
jgi:hypothetical protein